jgi:hypothetical protein
VGRVGLQRLLLLASVLILAACGGGGGSNPTPPAPIGKLCDLNESHSFEPSKIQGGHHLYFGSDVLELLDNPDFQVSSVELEIETSSMPFY